MATYFRTAAGSICARVRRRGFPDISKTFPTKVLAEKWAQKLEAEIAAGSAGVVPAAMTVGDLIDEYSQLMQRTRPFGKNKLAVLGYIKTWLGKERVARLSTARILTYITKERRIHGVTAGVELSYLSTVLRTMRAARQIPFNYTVVADARDILRLQGNVTQSAERDRRPTQDEIDQLRAWLNIHSRSLRPDHLDFILDSCFRPPSEITRLRWADLNEADRTIVIHDRKHPRKKYGNHQTVPLLGRCMEIIGRQPRGSELIFPVNGKSWSSVFPRACRELGIVDLTLYDLRHEAISRLVESGKYSIPEMMLVTGHTDPKMLMRYTQLRARDLHR